VIRLVLCDPSGRQRTEVNMTALHRAVLAVVGLCLFSLWSVPAGAQCCGPNGATGCTNAAQCCSGLCQSGTCVACLGLNQTCTGDSQCCSNLCTVTNPTGFPECGCLGAGQACSVDGQCCAPNTCGGGGTAGVCGCTSEGRGAACGGQICGNAVDNCGRTVLCGTCPPSAPKCCGDSCIPTGNFCM
jgi:hypothetical protein